MNIRLAPDAGVTLVEVMVGILVFALAATASVQTLASAQRARGAASNLMRATQLAAERMERVRAGERGFDPGALGMFERTWRSEPAAYAPDLERVDVTVWWREAGSRQVTLTCLMKRP